MRWESFITFVKTQIQIEVSDDTKDPVSVWKGEFYLVECTEVETGVLGQRVPGHLRQKEFLQGGSDWHILSVPGVGGLER